MDYSHFYLPYWNRRQKSVWEVFVLVFPLLFARLEPAFSEAESGQAAHGQCEAADENDQVKGVDARTPL